MWPAPCSCTTGINRMPAGAKISIASMKAEPMMPNMSVTPFATIVSTKASEGVILCTPLTAWRAARAMEVGCWLMVGSPVRFGNPERYVPEKTKLSRTIGGEPPTVNTIYRKRYGMYYFMELRYHGSTMKLVPALKAEAIELGGDTPTIRLFALLEVIASKDQRYSL